MKSIFLLFFTLIASAAYAYDCNVFSGNDYTTCLALNSTNEDEIANLIYLITSEPDHGFITSYNRNIAVTDAPQGYIKQTQGVIKDAWLALLTIEPSVHSEGITYVPKTITTTSEYDYSVQLPVNYNNPNSNPGSVCKVTYSLASQQAAFQTLRDDQTVGTTKVSQFDVLSDAEINASLDVQVVTAAREYRTKAYCCGYQCQSTCYSCTYRKTIYTTDKLSLRDSQDVTAYNHAPNASITFITQYASTTQGNLTKDNRTSVLLSLNQSSLQINEYAFYANFTQKPYYLLVLQAFPLHEETTNNLFYNTGTVTVGDTSNCTLIANDFFDAKQVPCTYNIQAPTLTPIAKRPLTANYQLLLVGVIIVLAILALFRVAKKYRAYILILVLAGSFATPAVHAASCGLTNLATCIPQKFFAFILSMLNAPLQPLLDFIKTLLDNPPSVALFQPAWRVVVTIISLFYGLLFVYSGYQFLTSGHDVVKREMAKEWLKNTVLMIIFVQASYFLYELVLDLGAAMASSVLSMVDPAFFQLTADNIVNIALEFLLILIYVAVLLVTILVLTVRYLVVAAGVIFAPIAVFCFYVQPLRSYGRLILNLLGLAILSTFLAAIILLAGSMLVQAPIFQNFKIVVMIVTFLLVNLLFVVLGKHIIAKTALGGLSESISQAAKYVGKVL